MAWRETVGRLSGLVQYVVWGAKRSRQPSYSQVLRISNTAFYSSNESRPVQTQRRLSPPNCPPPPGHHSMLSFNAQLLSHSGTSFASLSHVSTSSLRALNHTAAVCCSTNPALPAAGVV